MESGTELAGRYRLEKLLGRGGMGEVWHACRLEVFLLTDNGSLWQSTFRLIHEGVLDWSNWVRMPVPPGTVTAIAACQLDWLHGALTAATSDGVVHFARYEIDVSNAGLSTWSQWAWVPNS